MTTVLPERVGIAAKVQGGAVRRETSRIGAKPEIDSDVDGRGCRTRAAFASTRPLLGAYDRPPQESKVGESRSRPGARGLIGEFVSDARRRSTTVERAAVRAGGVR